MKIELYRRNDALHFEAINEEGLNIHMDGAAVFGGEGKGMRPMETLLCSLAGCSAFDIVVILKKMKQDLKDMRVTVKGERESEGKIKPLKTVHMHFALFGDIKDAKAEKAVSVSVEKYCSVGASLNPDIEVGYDYEIIPA